MESHSRGIVGGPLQLRVETTLGCKMIKWLRSIDLVEDYRTVGAGQGGYREDFQSFRTDTAI
jgi:sulfoxide reductase catalytic subunit YedY